MKNEQKSDGQTDGKETLSLALPVGLHSGSPALFIALLLYLTSSFFQSITK